MKIKDFSVFNLKDVETPIYTLRQVNDAISQACNTLDHALSHGDSLRDIEEYLIRWGDLDGQDPRVVTHLINVITAHLAIHE